MGQIYCEISVDAFFSDFQRIRDLEDKTDIQKRQIKDLEEKVGSVTLVKHTDELCFESSAPVLLNYMTFLFCSVSCTCWWWSTVLSFQFVSVDADFNLKILHDIIKYVMGIWYVCVCTYLKTDIHVYIYIDILIYLYIRAVSSMDCSHCCLACLKIQHMLFLISSFMTYRTVGYHDVTVTPQVFNMMPIVTYHQNY